jgi:IK cytokine
MEEYSEYMSSKEALPKAAFQFGVKMNDGRKTRKGAKSEKNEKAQLDRQWQQIQAIMQKRKNQGGGEGEPEPKTPKV